MKKDLTITLDNDEQIVIHRLVGKKLENCLWVIEKKKASEIENLENLEDKIRIYRKILEKLGWEEKDE